MGKSTGFLEFERTEGARRPPAERVTDYRECSAPLPKEELSKQGARCMDCGIPYCHALGCPVCNLIPEWNDCIYRNDWKEALLRLEATNNLPEITGRVCPAPCEAS
ncbi:MAG: glutamate synthase, partial [Chitinispirillaceae bacterium]|nr:glutamate synthase [Chitinispirillaceae bacterium]